MLEYIRANGEKERIPSIYTKANTQKKRYFCPFKVFPKEAFRGTSNDVFLISCNQSVRVEATQSSRFNLHPLSSRRVTFLVSPYNTVRNFQRRRWNNSGPSAASKVTGEEKGEYVVNPLREESGDEGEENERAAVVLLSK